MHATREAASGQPDVYEVASWHQIGVRPAGWTAMAVLRLTCGDQLAVCSREKQTLVLGREDDCDIALASLAASRQHCTIEHCAGDFVLRDHSSNGTYVTTAEGREIVLHNEKVALPGARRDLDRRAPSTLLRADRVLVRAGHVDELDKELRPPPAFSG